MKLLKVFLAPLLFFSVCRAVLGLGDLKKLGSIGGRTIGYYMLTTTLAIGMSLLLMNIFTPGKGVNLGIEEGFKEALKKSPKKRKIDYNNGNISFHYFFTE